MMHSEVPRHGQRLAPAAASVIFKEFSWIWKRRSRRQSKARGRPRVLKPQIPASKRNNGGEGDTLANSTVVHYGD